MPPGKKQKRVVWVPEDLTVRGVWGAAEWTFLGTLDSSICKEMEEEEKSWARVAFSLHDSFAHQDEHGQSVNS